MRGLELIVFGERELCIELASTGAFEELEGAFSLDSKLSGVEDSMFLLVS